MRRWLGRVKHDLMKHALWRARDLRETGGAPRPSDLAALRASLLELRDGSGEPMGAAAVWRELRAEAEAMGALPSVLDGFEAALRAAEAAVTAMMERPLEWRASLDRLLLLDAAFEELARTLKQ